MPTVNLTSKIVTPVKAVPVAKTAVLNAVVVDAKPTTLGVGEVVKLTNDKGKVEYYVGTTTGQASKPISTLSKAVSAVNTQVKKSENIQTTALKTSQKIELAEIKQELTNQGLPAKDIKTILSNEDKANKAEVKQLSGLLSTDGLQYVSRDPSTNAFTTSANKPINGLTSLLAYNDPSKAPVIQNNIKSANDEVAKFQMTYGITQDFVPTGKNTTQGLNPYAIYQAIDKGDKLVFDATTNTYKPTEALAAAKGDQSGLMSGTSISKASARALGLITNTGVSVGQKANVSVDSNGNYLVRSTAKDAQGNYIDPYGKQKPLVDTGEKDQAGNSIYTMEARDDSKHNKVGVTSIYIKQPDGSFTLAGNADTSYTYIPKANIGKMVAGIALATFASAVGMPFIATNLVGPMLGMTAAEAATSSLAMGISGALVGGAVAGATGQNVLTGAALGGIGSAAYTALNQASQAAGGWSNLLDQVKAGDMSSFSTGITQAKPIADAAISAGGGIDNLAVETATHTQDLANAGIDTANLTGSVNNVTANAGIDFSQVTPATSGNAGINLLGDIGAGGPGINITSGIGEQLAQNAIANTITDPTLQGLINSAPITPAQTGLDVLNNTQWANVGTSSASQPSLLDNITNFVSDNPWSTAAAVGGVVAPAVIGALTPNMPSTPNYTAPLLTSSTPGSNGSNGTTDWNSYYNNLFKRQGVGAGNYLGYDLMNRLGDIPPELMGLLGTSAQPTTGVTSGQTAGVP